MTRLGKYSVGGAMAALLVPLTLTAPAVAHTADQQNDTFFTLAGVTSVSQARSGHELRQQPYAPDGTPIWFHLYYGDPDFVELQHEFRGQTYTFDITAD